MDNAVTDTGAGEQENSGRTRMLLMILIALTSALCVLTIIGIVIQSGRSGANDPAATDPALIEPLRKLSIQVENIEELTKQSLLKLMDSHEQLANSNEELAVHTKQLSESLSSLTTESLKLANDVTGITDREASAARLAGENIAKLTEELSDANKRIERLSAQLQDKTEEAADMLIKVNALIEMVARLRVTAGVTSEDVDRAAAAVYSSADVNSLPPLGRE